ncbi:hypothetical protein F8388_024530 [Cannabis sativa]|uniref:Pentatricopeptide repeat-containing protein n=1 Tax=Cannabis sativa TaxID=3483 RepID=A0A7J6GBJ6_CANSA|nr:hypothetical protein F8388_024530 [Cannabis sativa]
MWVKGVEWEGVWQEERFVLNVGRFGCGVICGSAINVPGVVDMGFCAEGLSSEREKMEWLVQVRQWVQASTGFEAEDISAVTGVLHGMRLSRFDTKKWKKRDDLQIERHLEMQSREIFPDLCTYNKLILNLGIAGMVDEAVSVYEELQVKGLKPDVFTML